MKVERINLVNADFEVQVQAFMECILDSFNEGRGRFYAHLYAAKRYGLFYSDEQALPVGCAKVEQWKEAMRRLSPSMELKKSKATSFVLQSMDEDVSYWEALNEAIAKFKVDRTRLENELAFFI